MATAQSHDEKRFEELVLYIAQQTRADDDFGRTKLAKVLFYADFTAYAEEGKPLVGASYEAFPFGPFPPKLETIEQTLAATGRAAVERLDADTAERGEYTPWKILPLDEPDLKLFEAWELEYVNQWITRIATATAKEISDYSHDHPGWQLAEQGCAEIPYETALLATEPPRRDVMDLARRRFTEQGLSGPPR